MAIQDRATTNGSLNPIENCYLKIPNTFLNPISIGGIPGIPSINIPTNFERERTIVMNNLPDISDTKSAVYNNEGIIGRSTPLYTYSHSGDRQISMQIHFFVVDQGSVEENLTNLNWIRSAVYPRESNDAVPFQPPPICRLKCGQLLGDEELCVILQSYSVKFPTDVSWDVNTFVPFRFDVDTSWLTVYTSSDLPSQHRIIRSGR